MQTTYPTSYDVGVDGQKIEGYPSAIDTGIAQGGTIKVGRVVTLDSTAGRDDKAVRAPAAAADITGPAAAGVAMWDPTYPFDDGDYKQYATLPVMKKGRMLMKSETAQLKGTNPYVRYASGAGGTVLGILRDDGDTSSAAQATWLKVIKPCAAGALCEVEVNLG